MGDYRFSLKMTFEMGDTKDQTDMWLNWSPDDQRDSMIDRHVVEWLEHNFSSGVADIDMALADAKGRRQKEERDKEIAELRRLRAKYPDLN